MWVLQKRPTELKINFSETKKRYVKFKQIHSTKQTLICCFNTESISSFLKKVLLRREIHCTSILRGTQLIKDGDYRKRKVNIRDGDCSINLAGKSTFIFVLLCVHACAGSDLSKPTRRLVPCYRRRLIRAWICHKKLLLFGVYIEYFIIQHVNSVPVRQRTASALRTGNEAGVCFQLHVFKWALA